MIYLWSFFLLFPYEIAITTPRNTIIQPRISNNVIVCCRMKIFNITVNGAAKENRILFLLGPIVFKAKNKRVSPKNTPINPEIIIAGNKFIFIDDQPLVKNAYNYRTRNVKWEGVLWVIKEY